MSLAKRRNRSPLSCSSHILKFERIFAMSNARFSILQARAVKDRRISDSQFRTLAALGMYADEDGWCFPKLSTLGEDLSKSKQAVGRDTIALRKLGYLEVTPKFRADGSRTSSEYRLIFDTPRQRSVDAPSTSLIDTPSTPEVDALTTHITTQLTPKEIEEAGNKVMTILAMSIPPENYFKGREMIADNHLHFADWYHGVTNQVCTKKAMKSWWKAFREWQDAELGIEHLQEAYNMDVSWKKIIKDPNELTKTAIAIKAAYDKKPETKSQDIKLDSNGSPISY